MKKQFNGVLVGGFPSSGSTLLATILDSHPDIICGPETTLFCHPLIWQNYELSRNNLSNILFSDFSGEGILDFSSPNKPFLDYYKIDEEKVLDYAKKSNKAYDFFQNFFHHSVNKKENKICIDKTPQNIYAVDPFLRGNGYARAIIIKRDPRASLASLINRGLTVKSACANLALEVNIINSLIVDKTLKNRILFIDYEDLITKPKETCESICNYLNISSNYIDLMINRKSSSRKEDISSLKNSLLKTWTSNPLKKISKRSLYKWQDDLKAYPLLVLLGTSVKKVVLKKFVKYPKVIDIGTYLDVYGYSKLLKHKRAKNKKNKYDKFYASKVYENLIFNKQIKFIDKVKLPFKEIMEVSEDFLRQCYLLVLKVYKKILSEIKKIRKKFFKVVKNIYLKCKKPFLKRFYKVKDSLRKYKFIVKSYKFLKRIPKIIRAIFNKIYMFIFGPGYNVKYEWYPPKVLSESIDTVVGIAFLGRHNVLHGVIEEILRPRKSLFNPYVVVACSNSKDLKFAKVMQRKYKKVGIVFCDNKPIGNKWHLTTVGARKLHPKSLLITGSDDLVSFDYLKNNYNILMNDKLRLVGMIGPRTWYMLNSKKNYLYQVSYKNEYHTMPLGAGRLYSASYLNKIDWVIFERNFQNQLDDKGYYDVINKDLIVYNPTLDDGCILSIKGNWEAMNDLDYILKFNSINATKVLGDEKNKILKRYKKSIDLL